MLAEGYSRRQLIRRSSFALLAGLALLLLVISALPAIETNLWWVRLADFPRLQVALALLVLAILLVFYRRSFPASTTVLLGLCATALAYHIYVLWPYAPVASELSRAECPPGSDFSVLVANVKFRNDPNGKLIELVREVEPDVFLALETSPKWNRALTPLTEILPHTIARVSESAYSIHLFSRLPLLSPDIHYFGGQDTPQVVTGIKLDSGKTIRFFGVHPQPPMINQSTLGRDAVLFDAAFMAAESPQPALVAGDFNAVPWESAIVTLREIGHLQDPRRGYGYVPTFSATSWWMSWPLDQIFHQPGFAIASLKRLPDFGSDHYPLLGELCWIGGVAGKTAPELEPEEIEEARQTLKKARAAADGS